MKYKFYAKSLPNCMQKVCQISSQKWLHLSSQLGRERKHLANHMWRHILHKSITLNNYVFGYILPRYLNIQFSKQIYIYNWLYLNVRCKLPRLTPFFWQSLHLITTSICWVLLHLFFPMHFLYLCRVQMAFLLLVWPGSLLICGLTAFRTIGHCGTGLTETDLDEMCFCLK